MSVRRRAIRARVERERTRKAGYLETKRMLEGVLRSLSEDMTTPVADATA